MAKLVIFLAVAVILLASVVTTQDALAIHKKVNKFLREETKGGHKMTDLCTVTITVQDKENSTLKLKDCKPNDNQTQPPQPQCAEDEFLNFTTNECQKIPVEPEPCGPNEVWNGNTCECKDGFEQNETEACVPVPPQPTCPSGQFYNTTSKECQVIPNPEPVPTNGTFKIIGVGDVECSGDGAKVLDQIKKEDANLIITLGDLCYDSTATNFINVWGSLGNLLACVLGNHDSQEDGSSTLEKAFLLYCGNDYIIKNGNVLVVGINTNGDVNSQARQAVAKLSNATFMKDIDVTIIASHKPICAAPPNSHHPVSESPQVKTALCEPIKNAVGSKSLLVFLSGHNHVLSKGEQNGIAYIQSGAGGRSHYGCGTDAVFTFCNNTKWGFWEMVVAPDGTTTSQFTDSNGGKIQ